MNPNVEDSKIMRKSEKTPLQMLGPGLLRFPILPHKINNEMSIRTETVITAPNASPSKRPTLSL